MVRFTLSLATAAAILATLVAVPARAHPAAPPCENSTSVEARDLEKRSPIFPGQVLTNCAQQGTVAITLDDGPYGGWMYDAVGILTSKGAKATFFLNGNNYGCIYDNTQVGAVRYAYEAGMQIGSHTWSHPNMAQAPRNTWDRQVDLVSTAVQKIIGRVPAFLRFPYGAYNPDVMGYLSWDKKLVLVNWSDDTQDSLSDNPNNAVYDQTFTSAAASYPNPHIILSHVPKWYSTHDGLSKGIDALKAKGYRLTTVAECLGYPNVDDWYFPGNTGYGTPDASWTCAGTPAPGQA